MAAKKDTTAKVETEAKKVRKTSTPEERIAKLQAELEAAKARAEAKANKAINLQKEQRAKLIERRDALQEKIDALTDEIGDGDAGDNSFDEDGRVQLALAIEE